MPWSRRSCNLGNSLIVPPVVTGLTIWELIFGLLLGPVSCRIKEPEFDSSLLRPYRTKYSSFKSRSWLSSDGEIFLATLNCSKNSYVNSNLLLYWIFNRIVVALPAHDPPICITVCEEDDILDGVTLISIAFNVPSVQSFNHSRDRVPVTGHNISPTLMIEWKEKKMMLANCMTLIQHADGVWLLLVEHVKYKFSLEEKWVIRVSMGNALCTCVHKTRYEWAL